MIVPYVRIYPKFSVNQMVDMCYCLIAFLKKGKQHTLLS